MSTFSQLGSIARETDFSNRVQYALFVAAVNVLAEDPGTAGHALRVIYGQRVLANNYSISPVCYAVMANPTIAAEATVTPVGEASTGNGVPDGDIQFAVNSLWNAFSGV